MRFALALLFFLIAAQPASAQAVKKSGSGICHARGTTFYERTTRFTPFPTVDACIRSGGRLPATRSSGGSVAAGGGSARSAPPAAGSAYRREYFGQGWSDADGDCQDSRAEALIAASTTPVAFSDARRCRVVRGRWISLFTGRVIQNSSQIDIDHLVPLEWAWRHGADRWTPARREAFANDPVNLLPVEASLNRQKGSRGPDQWLPPANRCEYIARFTRVMRTYGLALSAREQAEYDRLLASCRQGSR